MKNIHVLPTNKPSRLGQVHEKLSFFKDRTWDNTENWRCKNIYITSDEKIENYDWVYCPVLKKPVFICLDSILMFKNLGYDSNGNSKYKKEWLKKIILTTDPDLIKDDVQAIDDEFLEWFVKNPRCEEVEVEHIPNSNWGFDIAEPKTLGYKIIIEVPERKKELSISDVSGSLYPTDEQILERVENFTKDMNVSNTTKKSIQFGFQEGMFQMLEIWKQSNNER